MKIKTNLVKSISRKIGNYDFEVGILDSQKKKIPNHKTSASFAGLRVSGSKGRYPSTTLADVAQYNDKRFGWLKRPFKLADNKDVGKVVKEIARQVFNKQSPNNKRLENAVQAVIRNPILRGDYGNNKASTVRSKGFDKLGIDTGQFFKNIKAKRI
tara:strand:- start:840 stop:1307 length:468 start_codon:yes stop_codon:yes gene_type:complete